MIEQSRAKIVAKLREIENEVAGHIKEGQKLAERFLQATLTAPREALFLYDSTRLKLLETTSSLANAERFLSKPSGSERISVGMTYLDRHGYASHILNKNHAHGASDENEPSKLSKIDKALALIRDKQSLCAKSLALLTDSRVGVQRECGKLLGHIQQSRSLSLLGIDAADDLDAVLKFVLNEERYAGQRKSREVENIDSRAISLLRGIDARLAIGKLIDVYLKELSASLFDVVKARKTQILKHAAQQRIYDFEAWCRCQKRDRYTPCCRAIAGLHFAYACEQNLDFGKLAPETRKQFEHTLSQASRESLERAIREIRELSILSEADFALFRYQERIWQAYLAVTTAT